MPRPRHANPSPEALRKRRQREKQAGRTPQTTEKPTPSARLIPVTVWIPPSSLKAIQFAAQRLRHAERIPESEVPE